MQQRDSELSQRRGWDHSLGEARCRGPRGQPDTEVHVHRPKKKEHGVFGEPKVGCGQSTEYENRVGKRQGSSGQLTVSK